MVFVTIVVVSTMMFASGVESGGVDACCGTSIFSLIAIFILIGLLIYNKIHGKDEQFSVQYEMNKVYLESEEYIASYHDYWYKKLRLDMSAIFCTIGFLFVILELQYWFSELMFVNWFIAYLVIGMIFLLSRNAVDRTSRFRPNRVSTVCKTKLRRLELIQILMLFIYIIGMFQGFILATSSDDYGFLFVFMFPALLAGFVSLVWVWKRLASISRIPPSF